MATQGPGNHHQTRSNHGQTVNGDNTDGRGHKHQGQSEQQLQRRLSAGCIDASLCALGNSAPWRSHWLPVSIWHWKITAALDCKGGSRTYFYCVSDWYVHRCGHMTGVWQEPVRITRTYHGTLRLGFYFSIMICTDLFILRRDNSTGTGHEHFLWHHCNNICRWKRLDSIKEGGIRLSELKLQLNMLTLNLY